MVRWLVVALASCGPSKVAIRATAPNVLEAKGDADLATCTPTKRIVVTDDKGAPVVDARVVVRQIEVSYCPSIGPNKTLFTTVPVRTDRKGVALICDPSTFYPDNQQDYCRHHREDVSVLVVAPKGAARISRSIVRPFDDVLRAVLGSCTVLRETDPTLPCQVP